MIEPLNTPGREPNFTKNTEKHTGKINPLTRNEGEAGNTGKT